MGMFQGVSEMNLAFGNPKGELSDFHIQGESHTDDGVETQEYLLVEAKWLRLKAQCQNILSEYNELMDALSKRDMDKVRDALCDINVFSLGAHHFIGASADEDMDEVLSSLYSRFCVDQKHLEETSDFYFTLGVAHYYEGEFPRKCLKSSLDQGMRFADDGTPYMEYPKGKFLKALGYRSPVFK